jgi:6-phosphogluconolactonase
MVARMETFPDRDALAEAAADILAQALSGSGPRTFVATGGTSPGPVYDRLAARDLGWAEVTVTLTDDRWVAEDSPLSNAGLVRKRLLTGRAAAARFAPLAVGGATPEADAAAAETRLATLLPAAATLLGMGEDGHIASLFPADPDLAARLDPAGARLCVGVPVAGLEPFVPRISLTTAGLLNTGLIVLMITGAAKRDLMERVIADAGESPPVTSVLRQRSTPLRVLWAP